MQCGLRTVPWRCWLEVKAVVKEHSDRCTDATARLPKPGMMSEGYLYYPGDYTESYADLLGQWEKI